MGLGGEDVAALLQLNTDLLVNVRNYFGQVLDLQNIAATEIGRSVNVPETFATAFDEDKRPTP